MTVILYGGLDEWFWPHGWDVICKTQVWLFLKWPWTDCLLWHITLPQLHSFVGIQTVPSCSFHSNSLPFPWLFLIVPVWHVLELAPVSIKSVCSRPAADFWGGITRTQIVLCKLCFRGHRPQPLRESRLSFKDFTSCLMRVQGFGAALFLLPVRREQMDDSDGKL